MIDKFLDYISIEKRYSHNTLISYKKDLEDFLLFVSDTEGTEDLRKADKKIVRNFIVSLSERKIQKRSINRKLSSLRSFYLFLLKIVKNYMEMLSQDEEYEQYEKEDY